MASLRARLIAGLLALAAIGLLVLAGVTYVEQRGFLLDRVDQQARAAPVAVRFAMEDGRFGLRKHDPDDGRPPPRAGCAARAPRRPPRACGAGWR